MKTQRQRALKLLSEMTKQLVVGLLTMLAVTIEAFGKYTVCVWYMHKHLDSIWPSGFRAAAPACTFHGMMFRLWHLVLAFSIVQWNRWISYSYVALRRGVCGMSIPANTTRLGRL